MLFSVFVFAACEKSGEADATIPDTEPEATVSETTAPETTAATTARPAPVPNTFYPFYENSDSVKLLGRSRFYKSAVALDWTAAGLAFDFEGSGDLKMSVDYAGDLNVVLEIEVDGNVRALSVQESGTIRLASDLEQGVHHVKVLRRTRAVSGAKGVFLSAQGVTMTGYFMDRPADNKYMVAFLGDSITCGVGLTANNGLLSYAFDLSSREGFDYDICAIPGIGVYRSSKTLGYTENSLTKCYPLFNYFRSATLRYMPDRQADLVVVNLNTNDQNHDSSAADETPYKETLKTLISEIRDAHGNDVPIVWVVGMMIAPDAMVNGWLNDVFAELGGESAGLYTITAETNNEGGSSHPNQASHDAVSQALSAFIREKNLLDLAPLTPSAE
jgi:lysophospholipase L1-like esterase